MGTYYGGDNSTNGKGKVLTLSVPRKDAERTRSLILEMEVFDPSRSIGRDGEVHFPLLLKDPKMESDLKLSLNGNGIVFRLIPGREGTVDRTHQYSPRDQVLRDLEDLLPPGNEHLVPAKYKRLGDCLILKFPHVRQDIITMIAGAYGEALGSRFVLRDMTGISGEFREPGFEVLVPPKNRNFDICHKENGVLYWMDPRKVMFSPGNIKERTLLPKRIRSLLPHPRLHKISKDRVLDSEIVVDMFAGIGYFSIPMALCLDNQYIFAVEKNPISFHYLQKNITVNGVEDRIIPILGDNREVLLEGLADRIVMGYVGGTVSFLPRAVSLSSKEGSKIHLHDTIETEKGAEGLFEASRSMIEGCGRSLELLGSRKLKSFAPRIDHIVLDLQLGPRT